MNMKQNVIIFSVFQKNVSFKENEVNTDRVATQLKERGIPFTKLEGAYNGEFEECFMVPGRCCAAVEEFCKEYNQECYLEQDANGRVDLVFADNRQHIGSFERVPEKLAKEIGSYTIVGNDYWVAR